MTLFYPRGTMRIGVETVKLSTRVCYLSLEVWSQSRSAHAALEQAESAFEVGVERVIMQPDFGLL